MVLSFLRLFCRYRLGWLMSTVAKGSWAAELWPRRRHELRSCDMTHFDRGIVQALPAIMYTVAVKWQAWNRRERPRKECCLARKQRSAPGRWCPNVSAFFNSFEHLLQARLNDAPGDADRQLISRGGGADCAGMPSRPFEPFSFLLRGCAMAGPRTTKCILEAGTANPSAARTGNNGSKEHLTRCARVPPCAHTPSYATLSSETPARPCVQRASWQVTPSGARESRPCVAPAGWRTPQPQCASATESSLSVAPQPIPNLPSLSERATQQRLTRVQTAGRGTGTCKAARSVEQQSIACAAAGSNQGRATKRLGKNTGSSRRKLTFSILDFLRAARRRLRCSVAGVTSRWILTVLVYVLPSFSLVLP